jgi:hypothetical protein
MADKNVMTQEAFEAAVAAAVSEAIEAERKAVQAAELVAAKAAEANRLLIDLSDDMKIVLTELGIDIADAGKFAVSAFESVMRGKVQSAIDRAIKAKYLADCKGKAAMAAELEKEIQSGIILKRLIS